jgi:hypothetical protein
MNDDGPVPGRTCGACDACCVVFEIQVPSIAKPAGVPCKHLSKSGCAIYEWRPDMCRHWLCGWRLIPGLPENWRPDLSGILIYQMRCEEPGYGHDAFIIALGKGLEHLSDTAVLGFIQNMVERRIPLFLTLHAGRAEARSTFLNILLEPCVAAKNGAAFITTLTRLVEAG